jgi:hypothetical protein
MLICKLEMTVPAGMGQTYPVGEVRIGQTSGDCFIADYLVEIDKASRHARTPGVWRSGEVRQFDHSHFGPYDLLLRGLIACLGGRSWTAIAAIHPSACTFTDNLEAA